MADTDTRSRCPWCTTRVNAEASICHGCGAICTRAPLSMVQLFFLFPVAAFALMLAGLGGLGLQVIPAAAVFAVAWTVFSLIHIMLRLRPRWMQVEPLLLEDDKDDGHLAHHAPAGFAPWWAGAATVAAGLAVIWAISPRSGFEPANAAVIIAIAPTSAPAPINVAVVAPPREALPPKPWAPAAQMASAEPPKVAIDAVKAESAKADASKAEMAKVEAAKIQTAAAPPAATPTATVQTATTDAAKTEPPADSQILTTQRLLAELGYLDGSPDGKMSASTRAALKEFRADMSIKGEAIDARLIAELQSVVSSRQQAESRRAQQTEAKRSEPKRAETRPAEPRRVVETKQAERSQAETQPMQQQASASPMQVSAPSPSVVVVPPPPPAAVVSPPPLAVLNGLTAARNTSQVQDQAPVRLAPVRLH